MLNERKMMCPFFLSSGWPLVIPINALVMAVALLCPLDKAGMLNFLFAFVVLGVTFIQVIILACEEEYGKIKKTDWGFLRTVNVLLGPLFTAGFITFLTMFLVVIPTALLCQLMSVSTPSQVEAELIQWLFIFVFVVTLSLNLYWYIRAYRLWKKGGVLF